MIYCLPVSIGTRAIDMVKDPVCGMEVDPKTSSHVMEYNGGSYYFCSENCLNEFRKDPEKYLRGGGGGSHSGHRHGGGCCGMMMGGGWATYAFLGFMLLLMLIRFFW